jgi:hypothetical protein
VRSPRSFKLKILVGFLQIATNLTFVIDVPTPRHCTFEALMAVTASDRPAVCCRRHLHPVLLLRQPRHRALAVAGTCSRLIRLECDLDPLKTLRSQGCVSHFSYFTRFLVVIFTPPVLFLFITVFFLAPLYWIDR